MLEDVSSAVRSRRSLLAIAGPCGSGKSTLASLLASENPEIMIVQEPQAPRDVQVAGAPAPGAIEAFQRRFSSFRQAQATAGSGRTLLFDRTFEEDREVFLNLHYRLGYIDSTQLKDLTQLSIQCENSVGRPDALLVLTAPPDILRRRLKSAPQQRPAWLVEHIEVQCELYAAWIANRAENTLVIDTSALDSLALVGTAIRYFAIANRRDSPCGA